MKALILAAGRGSRMGGLTEERPKCLVELAGRSLLSLQAAALGAGGADEIGIVRGYRAERIELAGACYFHNPRWAETNMVATLACAAEWLAAEPVLVSYSDIFYPANLVRRLAAAPGDLAISYDRAWRALWQRRFADPLADAETFRLDSAGRVGEIGARASGFEEIEGQYMGLLRFTPTAWREVEALRAELPAPERDRLDMTGLLSRLIARGEPIEAVATSGGWGEVDSADDLALYEAMVRSGELVLPGRAPATGG
jgi:choline kinase